ncbi:MAG: hypothetical protein QOD69_2092, partial [Solirubrobacteraceae bacterium]|nr:hypothetical protein [Solirubrobacteraceae bacterium]
YDDQNAATGHAVGTMIELDDDENADVA